MDLFSSASEEYLKSVLKHMQQNREWFLASAGNEPADEATSRIDDFLTSQAPWTHIAETVTLLNRKRREASLDAQIRALLIDSIGISQRYAHHHVLDWDQVSETVADNVDTYFIELDEEDFLAPIETPLNRHLERNWVKGRELHDIRVLAFATRFPKGSIRIPSNEFWNLD